MNYRPRIVVVGSANVGLTTFPNQFRRLGEIIFAPEFNLGFGGKGANPAVAVCRCGAEVTLVAWWATTCSARLAGRRVRRSRGYPRANLYATLSTLACGTQSRSSRGSASRPIESAR